MAHRVIVSVALAIMACFLLLSYFDPQLLLVHLYESPIYLAIFILFVRVDARWAYTPGMLAPACWLVLILIPTAWALFLSGPGGPPSLLREMPLMLRLQRPSAPTIVLEVITLILSVWMVLSCVSRWRREFAVFGKSWSGFLI
jgi:hypothetical protein